MTLELLNPTESRWIQYIQDNVVPKLEGTSADRARTGALVAWWSLKEGILDLTDPLRHNLCSQGGHDVRISDLATCSGPAWQVGISGIQPGAVKLADVEGVAKRLYPEVTIETLLEDIAIRSGVQGSAVDQIKNSSGDLRKSWLLRDGPISFMLQAPFVERGCLTQNPASWCFGSWDSARRFAPDQATAQQTVAELQDRFASASSPSGRSRVPPLLPWLLALGGAGIAWWWFRGDLRRRLHPVLRRLPAPR
jgi:hypothetical protein